MPTVKEPAIDYESQILELEGEISRLQAQKESTQAKLSNLEVQLQGFDVQEVALSQSPGQFSELLRRRQELLHQLNNDRILASQEAEIVNLRVDHLEKQLADARRKQRLAEIEKQLPALKKKFRGTKSRVNEVRSQFIELIREAATTAAQCNSLMAESELLGSPQQEKLALLPDVLTVPDVAFCKGTVWEGVFESAIVGSGEHTIVELFPQSESS